MAKSVKNLRRLGLLLTIVEGCCVMAIELLLGKNMESLFGTMFSAWTATLGVTLLGLSLGYFYGGKWSTQLKDKEDIANSFLLAASGLLVGYWFIPFGPLLVQRLDTLYIPLIITASAALIPSLFFLGTIPPLVIRLITTDEADAGSSTGFIYSVSAISGVFATLFTGFFIIPYFGIHYPVISIAVILLLVGFYLSAWKNSISRLVLFLGTLALSIFFRTDLNLAKNYEYKLYEEEGLMGQLRVVDQEIDSSAFKFLRLLLVNNITQSIIAGGDQSTTSIYKYVHIISSIMAGRPSESEVLLCGLAGGSLVSELTHLGNKIDVVDIDRRMHEVATEFFYLDESSYNFYEDDARHYIMRTSKKYDVVIIDISASESQPTYLYTLENFTRIKEVLKEDGLLIVNFQSPFEETSTNPGNLIYQTLHHAGYTSKAIAFQKDIMDDIIYIASPTDKAFDLKDIDYNRMNSCCLNNTYVQNYLLVDSFLQPSIIKPSIFLTDDKPVLEILKNDMLVNSRKNLIKEFD